MKQVASACPVQQGQNGGRNREDEDENHPCSVHTQGGPFWAVNQGLRGVNQPPRFQVALSTFRQLCGIAFCWKNCLKSGRRTFLQTSPSPTILDVCGLTIRYLPRGQKPIQALREVNVRLHPGEILGITGESGCGKSTLATSILKLLPDYADYSAGAVRFEGRDVLTMDESELRSIRGSRIALVSQDPSTSLNPVLKVSTQISEVLRAHLKLNKQQRRMRVLELLREVGFDDPERIASAYLHELSGGQNQRVVIAQAIACSPALLIADEPTSKLDSQSQSEILTLLSGIVRRHGAGLILITHDPAILIGLANRVAIMYAGSIVEDGAMADVVRNPLHPYTQGLLRLFMSEHDRRGGKIDRFPVIVGEAPDLSLAGRGCRFEPRCLERMVPCAVQDPKESAISDSHRVSCFKHAN